MDLKNMYEIDFRNRRLAKDVKREEVSDIKVVGQLLKLCDAGLDMDMIHAACDGISRHRPRLAQYLDESRQITDPAAFRMFLAMIPRLIMEIG